METFRNEGRAFINGSCTLLDVASLAKPWHCTNFDRSYFLLCQEQYGSLTPCRTSPVLEDLTKTLSPYICPLFHWRLQIQEEPSHNFAFAEHYLPCPHYKISKVNCILLTLDTLTVTHNVKNNGLYIAAVDQASAYYGCFFCFLKIWSNTGIMKL